MRANSTPAQGSACHSGDIFIFFSNGPSAKRKNNIQTNLNTLKSEQKLNKKKAFKIVFLKSLPKHWPSTINILPLVKFGEKKKNVPGEFGEQARQQCWKTLFFLLSTNTQNRKLCFDCWWNNMRTCCPGNFKERRKKNTRISAVPDETRAFHFSLQSKFEPTSARSQCHHFLWPSGRFSV